MATDGLDAPEGSPLEVLRALAPRQPLVAVGDVARLDVGRAARSGIPEVVLAATKSAEQLAEIAAAMLRATGLVAVTRLRRRHRAVLERLTGVAGAEMRAYGARSLLLVAAGAAPPATAGLVGLLAAGTGDLEALAEARLVLDCAGVGSRTVADVGVAGLHRLHDPLRELLDADVDALVVGAGMDGALPSVVAGLAGVPVVGLPTSTGYGHGGRGRGALLAMLQSCAPGLVVVNIDNGVGAGAAAALVALRRRRG